MGDDNKPNNKEDIAQKLKGKYILTYLGSKDEFNQEYLDILLKNQFEPARYISLTGKTIVFLNDIAQISGTEDKSTLEDRLKIFYSDKLSVEQDREYKTTEFI
jgi:hypothetical protein